MRDIPADILAKIQSLNQTIFNNAEPKMEAVITKAIRSLEIKTIRTGTVGSIDIAALMDGETVAELWIIGVVSAQAVINVYTYAEDIDFSTPTRTFTLTTEEVDAKVKDVAIAFDGALPWLFWVERGASYDKIWALQWDGADPVSQPAGTEIKAVAR